MWRGANETTSFDECEVAVECENEKMSVNVNRNIVTAELPICMVCSGWRKFASHDELNKLDFQNL